MWLLFSYVEFSNSLMFCCCAPGDPLRSVFKTDTQIQIPSSMYGLLLMCRGMQEGEEGTPSACKESRT